MSTTDTTTPRAGEHAGDGRALLEAGAILPLTGAAGADGDLLTARSYRHPALDGRAVVRLVPGALGPAEDLALEYLGMTAGAEGPAEVGRVARRALGFPAWALVHDPANGHHALAVVKEMERLTRLITTKPGNAKDGFDEIGARLDRSVPAFLPTYYEQVGRLFLGGESRAFATAFFGKAREAERLHGLAIDEDRLREVFVEFAAAGALSVKALRDHAKSLAVRLSPAAAFTQFEALCLSRTAAGLAPYAGMLEDLRRLAKAAGEDGPARTRELVARVLDSGSVERAPASFWKAAHETLGDLARADARVRLRLLELRPAAGGDTRAAFDAAWLGLLDGCGALALLEDGTVPAAGWLSGWARHRLRGWGGHPRVAGDTALVARLAARLRADGVPVELTLDRWRDTCDLDLLDACLAAGVPVADPPSGLQLPLAEWLDDTLPGRRDLAAVTADARFAPPARQAVELIAGTGDGPARLLDLVGSPVFRPVISGWFADRAAELSGEFALPWLGERLSRLARFDDPVLLATAPEAVRAIAATDVAPALARTLRGGLFGELGWEALEEAAERIATPDGTGQRPPLHVHDAWPELIVRTTALAARVSADAIEEERPLVLPVPSVDRWDNTDVRYADGQWLVLSGQGDKRRGVWSGRPGEVFEPGGSLGSGASYGNVSYQLPDGGRAFGGRPLHAGDTVFGPGRAVISDGVSFWALEDGEWREFDAAAGRLGRRSVPAFLDAALAEGTGGALRAPQCRLASCPPGLESSPFGTKDGLLGWWVRADDEGRTLTACSVDGGRHTVTTRTGRRAYDYGAPLPLPPMRLPGGAALYPQRNNSTVLLCDESGRVTDRTQTGAWSHGVFVPPLSHWHHLRPRDASGSAALRAVTEHAAATMLAAVAAGRTPEEAVAATLPSVTHPRLLAAVAGRVREAARCTARLARLAERAARPVAAPVVARHARDGVLGAALEAVWSTGRSYGRDRADKSSHILARVAAVVRFLEHGTATPDGFRDIRWTGLIGHGLAAALWRAASPATGDEERLAVAELAAVMLDGAGGLLADPRGLLRTVELTEPVKGAPERLGTVLTDGDRRLFVFGPTTVPKSRRGWTGLEYDPAGVFGSWPGLAERCAQVHGAPDDAPRAEGLRRAVRLLTERGALPCLPEAAAELAAAASITECAAATLLLGLPELDAYGRTDLPRREVLEGYGLGAAEAELARLLLAPVPLGTRTRLLAALVPAAPEGVERLWDGEVPVAAAAAVWTGTYGRLPRVPSAVLIRARRERTGPALLLSALTPARQPELMGRTRQLADQHLNAQDPAALLDGSELAGYAQALRWMAYRLPGGDPLRAALPETLRVLRERLSDPELLMSPGGSWTARGKPLAAVVRAAHGLPETGGGDAHGHVAVGPALVLVPAPWGNRESVWLRTAALTGADDPALTLLTGLLPGDQVLRALRDVLGAELAGAVAPAADGFPHDPSRSVPELVAGAAAALECGQDAAALYLMLLALPDPTDRHVAEWTGWKPARLRAARAELAATGRVVGAKRSRAGRSLFLPGGWAEHPAPRLPAEMWKEPLYDAAQDGVTLPSGPVAELFRTAWARVSGGDAPAYEEFVSRRGGRGGAR